MDLITSMSVFVQAVEAGSFAAVAESMNISSQMVGKHIRHLENRLGSKLLNKSTRKQSLTPLGQQYYARCQLILSEVKSADDEAHRYLNAPKGKLKLASPLTFGYLLTPVIVKFMQNYNDIDIDLILTNRSVDLINEGFDAVIRIGNLENNRLIARKLVSYKLIPCASPVYLQKHGFPHHPNDLSHHQCLHSRFPSSLKSWTFTGPDGNFTTTPQARLTLDNSQAQILAAMEGAGIVLQPYPLVSEALKNGKLIRVLDQYQADDIDVYLMYTANQRNTLKFTAFLEYLLSTLPLSKMLPIAEPSWQHLQQE